MHQYTFDLVNNSSYTEEDFIESPSNSTAKKWIDSWPHWQGSIFPKITYIYGPASCGKTHLTKIWQKKTAAKSIGKREIKSLEYHDSVSSFLIDDIEPLLKNEVDLLLFINYVIENEKYLILTAKVSAYDLNIKLPDLASRLHAIKSYTILDPTSTMTEQMLVKIFSDQQIVVGEEAIKYLANRTDRSYDSIKDTVTKINQGSLEQNKRITIPLIKSILGF